jgi:Rrf2 family protein
MRISAKADYAVRAVAELAAADGEKPVKAERVATAQGIPLNFLENILGELRHAGIVRSHRGAEGGFRLAKPATELTVADVIRAVEGPLASVRGGPPEDARYDGAAAALPTVWIAVRANLRRVMETVTIDDIARSELPATITELTDDPGAWATR